MISASSKIAAALEKLKDKNCLLISMQTKSYQEIRPLIAQQAAQNLKGRGIYISFNAPSSTIKSMLKETKISPNKYYIIDGVGSYLQGIKMSSERCGKEKDIYCLPSPKYLTELSIVLSELVKSGQYGFVIFDNLSTFFIYNDLETSKRFMHYYSVLLMQ